MQSLYKLDCLEPKVTISPPLYFFKPFSEPEVTCNQLASPRYKQDEKKKLHKEDVEDFSDASNSLSEEDRDGDMNRGEWTTSEHEQFMKGNTLHGKNWALIAKQFVRTRTRQQVRNHAVKFFLKSEKQNKIMKTQRKTHSYPVMTFNY
jgi:hypothetical protein